MNLNAPGYGEQRGFCQNGNGHLVITSTNTGKLRDNANNFRLCANESTSRLIAVDLFRGLNTQ
jgi:hypothetical protein